MMSWCLMSSDVIWHIRDKLWPMPKHGSIKATYVTCMRVLAVTCHLHFWQNDRDLLRATVVTRGWNGSRNKSQHRKSTLEKKILPPFQQGFEPATFQSRVRRSNHWAIPPPPPPHPPYYYYWLLLYSAVLRFRADSLRSHVILQWWIAFYSVFLKIHRGGVFTALAWLVPHETAAIPARSVYTIQPCTMSLHAKPHT